MAEIEKEVVKKREEDVSKFDNAKNNISNVNNEQIENVNENNNVNYIHPVVTEKKGFINLMDYERNYEDIKAHDIEQQTNRQLIQQSKGFVNIEEQPEKEENGEKISPTFTDETKDENNTKKSKETSEEIRKKHENDKIDESIAIKKDKDDVKDVPEQTTLLPEEAYVQHMERVIASNALPSRDMEILQNLYTTYTSDKKQTPTEQKIYTEIDVDTSEPSESETVTHDQIKETSTSEKEKVILDTSSKNLEKDILQSDMQDKTKDLTSTESPIPDDKKLKSLKSDPFVEKDKIITSTSKTNLVEKISTTSDLKTEKNDKYDENLLTIESPFSDFTLQTVKLETNFKDSLFEEQSDNSEILPSSIHPSDTEKITPLDESKIIADSQKKKDLTKTKEALPSSIHLSDTEKITPLDESKIIADSQKKKDLTETKEALPSSIHPSDIEKITPLDESKIIADSQKKKDLTKTKEALPTSIHLSDTKKITPLDESKVIVDSQKKKDLTETKEALPTSIHLSDTEKITPLDESKIIADSQKKKDLTKTKEALPTSIHLSDTEKITPLDESEVIVDFPEKKDLIRTKVKISKAETDESFIRKMLLCHCIDVKMDTKNNGNNSNDNNNDNNNNNASIIERIRRYFLSLLIDYLVSSQIPNTKNKTSYYY